MNSKPEPLPSVQPEPLRSWELRQRVDFGFDALMSEVKELLEPTSHPGAPSKANTPPPDDAR